MRASADGGMAKLVDVPEWVRVPQASLRAFACQSMRAIGCSAEASLEIADHLIDAELAGIESHGVQRVAQYVEQAAKQLWTPAATPRLRRLERGGWIVDGNDCMGITAVRRRCRVRAPGRLA